MIVEPTSGNTGVGLAIVAPGARLPVRVHLPGQGGPGQDQRAARLRRRGRRLPGHGGARSPATPTTASPAGWPREMPGGWQPDQYANPDNPLAHYATRPGPEIWAQTDGTGDPLRGRDRHRGHDLRHRPVPEGGVGRRGAGRSAPTRRARCTPAGPGAPTWSRASARTSGPRPTTGSVVDEVIAVTRRGVVPHDAAAGPRGGAAHRRLVRARGGGRAARGRRRAGPTTSSSCCCPTGAAGTCRRSSTTSGWRTTGSWPPRPASRPSPT